MLKHKLTLICLLGLLLPFFSVEAGIILDAHKFAWGDSVGYISFENVVVNDSALSGYAWSTNKGWINFSPAMGGVSNDGAGNLSGSAWGEGLGWIDFDNVSISPSTGKFSGTATSALSGTITFDCPTYCDVETDWRPGTPPTPPPPAPPPASGNGGGSRSGDRNVTFTPFPIFGTSPTAAPVLSPISLPARNIFTNTGSLVPGLGQFGQETPQLAQTVEGQSPSVSLPAQISSEIGSTTDESSTTKSFSMIWLVIAFMGFAAVYIVWRMWQEESSN